MRDFHTRAHQIQRNIADFIKERRTVKLLHVLRNYSALVVVISSAILVAATNIAAGKGSGGFLFGAWGKADIASPLENKISGQINKKNNLVFVPLAKASTAIEIKQEADDSMEMEIVDGQAMATFGSVLKDPEEDGGVKMYTVENGDTLSSIAVKNNISVNTILWANDITNADSIMPGDQIFILPVAGVTYTIKKGDNLDDIAKKYKSEKDKIIAFNSLPANGEITEGETIIIPDGQKDTPRPSQQIANDARRQYATPQGGAPTVSGWRKLDGKAGTGHRFPYGYCTWYVAQRRYVPWGGNAGTWLYHAKVQGYKTGKTPAVGAIMVSSESWWGHVAIVEKVSGNNITISEMNYKGWSKSSKRTLAANSRVIKGYIY